MDERDTDTASRVLRRTILQAVLSGAGGVATAGILPFATGAASAAPADPGAGAVVTPNPIKSSITKSGVAVEAVPFCTVPSSSGKAPLAHLNFLYHAGDGSGLVYVCDGRGRIWRIDRAGRPQLFLDVKLARGGALYFALTAGRSTTGLRSFAFHPNFARSGTAGFGRFYTATTETAASYQGGNVPLFPQKPDYPVQLHCVVAEWRVDPANPARALPSSRRELLRVTVYKDDHNIDQLMFDPNIRPGENGYGMMFIGVGDGGNVVTRPDPYKQAQNLGRALGKILRINPLRQKDGRPYGVPASNPFVGQTGKLAEIWAYGLRHPLNLSFDTGGTGALIIADIGQAHVEEINLGVKGANYGWPQREGTFVTDRADGRVLYAPPAGDATSGLTFPVAQYDHYDSAPLGLAAVTGGFVYRGTAVPALVGQYLFGDIVSGRVFHVPVASLRLGSLATIKELTFRRGGTALTMKQLTGADTRVDLRFGQDQAGEVYVMSKHDGVVRRLAPA